MTTLMQALYGLAMIAVGGLKTWLHVGSVPAISVPMCSGKTLTLAASQPSWIEQTHCWGCYMFAAGLVWLTFAGMAAYTQRRSVTANMD
ncbi:MAG: hypothetical protein VX599_00965 [Pseudomonadota bacterium]|nr:hypothetical protein [Pseudomonadota bacterium]